MTGARRPARPSLKPDPIADATRYLSRGDRSAAEIEHHLISRGYPRSVVGATLKKLHRLGYVNDEAMARRMAQARLARRPMGRDALAAELKSRGFSAETIIESVRAAYEGMTEQTVAQSLLRSLAPRHGDPVREGRRRTTLLRWRGFPDDVIEAVLMTNNV